MQYVDYVFLLPGNNFSSQFLESWTTTVEYMKDNNITYTYGTRYSPNLFENRNSLLGNFPNNLHKRKVSNQIFSGELECKKVFFIDNDMVWTLPSIIALMKSDKKVISGICTHADGEKTTLLNDGKTLTIFDINFESEADFEVDAAGLGFLVCDFEVLQNLKYPWFREGFSFEPGTFLGDDYSFCKTIKNAGYSIYADTRSIIGHIKSNVVWPKNTYFE